MAARNMSGTVFAAGFIVAVCLCTGALAESSSSCTNVLISMSPCLPYIQGNSATPSPSCCTQLANVVGWQPRCLCEVLNGGGSTLGIKVNQTQAMALPEACNVKTPPVSRCNVDKDGGPKAVPPADDGTAGRNSAKLLFSLLFFLLLSFVAI